MASVGWPFQSGPGPAERAGVLNFVGRARANQAGAPGRRSVCRLSPRCVSVFAMSAIELAIEKVKHLDEGHARQLLAWLQAQEPLVPAPDAPVGARALLGFARRFRAEARPTAGWLAELREGERD